MLILKLLSELMPCLALGFLIGRFKPGVSSQLARSLIRFGVPIGLMGLLLKSGLDWRLLEALGMAILAICLLIALISQQDDLELMDHEAPRIDRNSNEVDHDPARWLDRNRRVLKKYQSLVRTAITLDALLDAEYASNDS